MSKRKFLIVGLGNFGSALGKLLTNSKHDVIGVDRDMSKVIQNQGKIRHVMCIDIKDLYSLEEIPSYNDIDVVVVAIGEDFGASLLVAALVKQSMEKNKDKIKPKKIIARGISEVHKSILEELNVDQIIMPEEEAAKKLAVSLGVQGVLETFESGEDYAIVEVKVPKSFVGRTVKETGIRNKYHLNIVTIKRVKQGKNILGRPTKKSVLLGVVKPDDVLKEDDELIVFGKKSDIERFSNDHKL